MPYAPINPSAKSPGADTGTLLQDVCLLQKEMNSAMGHLFTTRASLDTHWRKQVSDFEMVLHQNEAKATKAIRQAKVHCGSEIREPEACCAADIREAESHCVCHAHTMQQSYSDNMQCLEREAIEKEGKDCQSFLAAGGMALWAWPQKTKRY